MQSCKFFAWSSDSYEQKRLIGMLSDSWELLLDEPEDNKAQEEVKQAEAVKIELEKIKRELGSSIELKTIRPA